MMEVSGGKSFSVGQGFSRVVSGLSEIIGVGKFYCEHLMNHALHLGRDL